MGDPRRFDAFAAFIATHFPDRELRIADVAGGRGWLQRALRERGYRHVTTFDTRNRHLYFRGQSYRRCEFAPHLKWRREFDLLLAMHPDEATDVVIDAACQWRVPYLVVPCCVRPTAWTFWERHTHPTWLAHLKRESARRGITAQELVLPIRGKNRVLLGGIT